MNIVFICIVCMVTAVICRSLARESGEFSSALSVCTVIVISSLVLYAAADIITAAKKIYDSSMTDDTYFNIMIKGAGICIITKTSADCCRDCGESALASVTEAAGRLAMLIVSLPLFSGILSIIEALMT